MGVDFHEGTATLCACLTPGRGPLSAPAAAQTVDGHAGRGSQVSAVGQFAYFAVDGVETADQAEAEFDLVFCYGILNGVAPFEGRCHWFFTENVHAGFGRGNGGFFVEEGRRGNQDGVHVLSGEHGTVVRFEVAAHLTGQVLPFFFVHVTYANHIRTIQYRGTLGKTDSHVATPDYTQFEGVHLESLLKISFGQVFCSEIKFTCGGCCCQSFLWKLRWGWKIPLRVRLCIVIHC